MRWLHFDTIYSSLPPFILQEVRRTTFINISAAAKPFIGLISTLGPEFLAFGSQLLEQNVAAVMDERARRRAAGGAGPSGAPEGPGGPGAAAAAAAATAATATAAGRSVTANTGGTGPNGALGGGAAAVTTAAGLGAAAAAAAVAAAAAASAAGPGAPFAGAPLQGIQNPPSRLSQGEKTKRYLSSKEAREAQATKRAARAAALGPHAEAIEAAMKHTSLKQLKTALRAVGLRTTGKKAELLLRLAEHKAGGGVGGAGGGGGGGGVGGDDGDSDSDGRGGDSDNSDSDSDGADPTARAPGAPGIVASVLAYFGL